MTTGPHERMPLKRKFRGPVLLESSVAIRLMSPKPGFSLWRPWVSYILHPSANLQFPSSLSFPKPATMHLEHRILDILEALDTALHLLRRGIISPLRVFVDVQLVMLVVATLVLSLHDVLTQDLGHGLYVLDRIVDLFGAGLESS
jgi:hypothetical protein